MSIRIWAKASVSTVAVAAGLVLTAPPANAQFIGDIFAAQPVGSSLDIAYAVATDTPPFTCKWSARDLDQFGKVNAGARVHNTIGATFTTTVGPYVSGHRVKVEFFCRDRSGGTLAQSDTITIP